MGKSKTNEHWFFCVKCGAKTPLARKRGQQKEKFHRKKLWCYHCKEEINHIECRNEIEIAKFKEDFERGLYIEEAEASLKYIKEEKRADK
jgi:hypothetical protein